MKSILDVSLAEYVSLPQIDPLEQRSGPEHRSYAGFKSRQLGLFTSGANAREGFRESLVTLSAEEAEQEGNRG